MRDPHGNIFRIAIRENASGHEYVSQAYDNEEDLLKAAAFTKKNYGDRFTIQLQYSPVPGEGQRALWLMYPPH